MDHLRHLDYKNENTQTKYLNDERKNRTLKEKNSLLELEKAFKELRERETIKRQRMKNQKGNRRGVLKLIIVPIDDINKLGKKIMKKRHLQKTLGTTG